ncbi:type IV pilus assembly protein PilN [Bryocella elongata]|uniref:Type IV pilus assembly protein PilN n=1 Tax=Bryocella elongata TaxID=863522 RepID=A0A1H5W0C2_9BACT|nr:PilN domain-containing protein [Bryocella elongata]SEF92920.1 type IV pilus assembly protein PilN [Bryocella elongata]
MRISVNLATRPFVELRPYLMRLRILMGALVLAGVGIAVASHMMQQQLDVQKAKMAQLKQRTLVFENEKLGNERRMHQPDNAAVLDRAHFLNALFLRKSFSWTAVMMDLERVLPTGVQVTSIEPQVNPDGSVVIRLRVAGDRGKAVDLVRNLERSERFLRPRLNSESQQSKQGTPQQQAAAGPAGVEFEILADYNPLPEGQAFPKAKPVSDVASEPKRTSGTPIATPHVRNHGVTLPPLGAPGSPYNRPRPGQPQGGAR